MLQDPLEINVQLQGIDTSYPLMPEGDYRLQLVESPIEPNYDKTVLVWNPKFATIEPITAIDSRPIAVGTKVFMQWPIEVQERPEPKYPGAWLNTLCDAVDAVFGTTKEDRPAVTKLLLESATGKTVLCHVIIDEDKQGVKRNKIKRLKKAA